MEILITCIISVAKRFFFLLVTATVQVRCNEEIRECRMRGDRSRKDLAEEILKNSGWKYKLPQDKPTLEDCLRIIWSIRERKIVYEYSIPSSTSPKPKAPLSVEEQGVHCSFPPNLWGLN